MITKYSFFNSQTEAGVSAVPLFGAADPYFEKVASQGLLPDVYNYIAGLTPVSTSQYVLVNALGAFEYYGSNVNGDAFAEAALIHKPDDWTGNPVLDKIKARDWPYGFPTFYRAHPYAHHRNKDATRAFGEVELAAWNPHMKRVELVTRLDHDKCQQFGGIGVWDKLKAGGYPDVSMGSKVPFDTCSICLDVPRYRDAIATFDPKRHAHPGHAVLEVHKKKPIRGVSITRKDYCDHCTKMMNRILPDGRKVFVHNDFPNYFDISYVFIGADRTAKTMLFIFGGGVQTKWAPPDSSSTAPKDGEKTAAIATFEQLRDWDKQTTKSSEIVKERMPSNLAGKAVPLLTRQESDIPSPLLNDLAALPLEKSLSTLAGLGMLLRPREFQRIVLVHCGQRGLADKLEDSSEVFSKTEEQSPLDLGPQHFLTALLPMLLPLLSMRSGLGPVVEPRASVLAAGHSTPKEKKASKPRLHNPLLQKVAAYYNGYRTGFMDLVPHAQVLLGSSGSVDPRLVKIAAAPVEDVFTPLCSHYFNSAFLDEVGDSTAVMVQE